MTVQFSKEEFEAALPKGWWPTGKFSEYSYELEVVAFTPENPNQDLHPRAKIIICSSIQRGSNFCDGNGKNSIRHWLVDLKGDPVCPKLKEWTARTKNWKTNMRDALRDLYKIGLCIKPCSCGKGEYRVYRRKDGPDEGKLFLSCTARCKGSFHWLSEVVTLD